MEETQSSPSVKPTKSEKGTNSHDQYVEIYEWIDKMTLSRPRKNIARDFSDGVLMAELLKKYCPRLVDVHNYVAGNSVAKKVDNWCTLNRKVLSKFDIKLNKDMISKLAHSQSGAIEKVLMDLRDKLILNCNAERDTLYFSFEENGKGETVHSVLDPDQIANKTVPRHVFVKLKKELEEKDGVIQSLTQKIYHLESILHLKEQRIQDLTVQLMKPGENKSPRRHSFTKSRMGRL